MLLLALVPGIILFLIVWKYDTVEKEPLGLLLRLFVGGALTILSAQGIGLLGENILRSVNPNSDSLLYRFLFAFALVAFIEEGGKFLVMKLLTWKSREFNYTFDGVVYATTVSLGFAVVENVIHVLIYGSGADIARILFSVPGHVICAVFMGFFYGLARYSKGAGEEKKCRVHLAEALLVPTAMHGFYLFCLNTKKDLFFCLFIAYEILLTVITVRQFKKLSDHDAPIPGTELAPAKDEWVQKGDWDEG